MEMSEGGRADGRQRSDRTQLQRNMESVSLVAFPYWRAFISYTIGIDLALLRG
jgi:hypothetical protein